MQLHLQPGNLVQVEPKESHPVQEAIAGALAQGCDLANVRGNSASQLVKESGRNKVGRCAAIALPAEDGKLGDRVA